MAKVVVPLLLGLLVVRFTVNLPLPSWNLPLPDIDLPRIPWPDIPWPDLNLPDWQAPEWVSWVAERAKYVWPVMLALILAKGEINRRRKQDTLRAERNRGTAPATHSEQDEHSRNPEP